MTAVGELTLADGRKAQNAVTVKRNKDSGEAYRLAEALAEILRRLPAWEQDAILASAGMRRSE